MRTCAILDLGGIRATTFRYACRSAASRARCPAAARQLQCRALSSSAPSHPLMDWVSSKGGTTDGVYLADLKGEDGGSGWGLRSSQSTKEGQVLISLPTSLHLTYNEDADPALLALIDKVPEELWGAKLGLRLLAERARGESSSFAPYISHLPLVYEGVPLFFSPQAVNQIQYPPVTEQIKKRGRWLFNFWKEDLEPLAPEAGPFQGQAVDANAMGWAMAAVSSRAFRTRGPAQPASMLPLIDMCNHSFSPNVEIKPAKDGVLLMAARELAEGEPLLLNYGPLSNDFLFLDYGFVLPNNPHDRVDVSFDATLLEMGRDLAGILDVPLGQGRATQSNPGAIAPAPWQEKLLTELRLLGPDADTKIEVGGSGHVDPRILAGLRVLYAKEESEVKALSLAQLQTWDGFLGRDNEEATIKTIAGMLAVALANFTSTLDTDRRVLEGAVKAAGEAGGQVDENVLLAIRFRAEKKQVLTTAVAACGERLKNLAALKAVGPSKGVTDKGFGKK